MTRRLCLCLSLLVAGTGNAPVVAAADLEAQRQAFRDAWPQAELGNWQPAASQAELLADYPLWPDLRAAWLRARLRQVDERQIVAFIERFAGLKAARELRYRYAVQLGEAGRHADYLRLYRGYYARLDNARLDCLALRAEFAEAGAVTLTARARALWLVGHSQDDACDPAFAALREAGLLDDQLYRERFELAVTARELSMVRYLARSLPPAYRREAAEWTAAYGEPGAFLERHDPARSDATYRRQLLAAIEQLAYDEPQRARRYWHSTRSHHEFSAAEQATTDRHVALWLARHHHDDAAEALAALRGAAVDTEVTRWRIRSALLQRSWSGVLQHIDALPPRERDTEKWRYWRAVALQQSGDGAEPLFAELATERSYYGFLAADAIGADYAWRHVPLVADNDAIAALEARPDLVRARELYYVGLEGRGRSEWNAVVFDLPAATQVQAALLADRWGWHSRAIATAANIDRYDDLALRYPLPFAEAFARHAAAADIRRSWALGVARSESLFMRDVRSPAGAIGVMQVTPATARRTARALDHPYAGYTTLMDVDSNIRLGTGFLGEMLARFAQNPVLATAAYNAGPLRVEAWLPTGRDLDASIWVEAIPYRETRRYVRRVMTADTIFHWRLHGSTRRLSSVLPPVGARPGERLAAN